MSPLTSQEAARIVRGIQPHFEKLAGKYDTAKYPPETLLRLRSLFATPGAIGHRELELALRWKYGHRDKPNIPAHHVALVRHLAEVWPAFMGEAVGSPSAAFERLSGLADGRRRFVTVAFLVHLMFPDAVPIIDQHNFRSMNYLISRVRPAWVTRARPSSFGQVTDLGSFIEELQAVWSTAEKPSTETVDHFLMMHGKALKAGRGRFRFV